MVATPRSQSWAPPLVLRHYRRNRYDAIIDWINRLNIFDIAASDLDPALEDATSSPAENSTTDAPAAVAADSPIVAADNADGQPRGDASASQPQADPIMAQRLVPLAAGPVNNMPSLVRTIFKTMAPTFQGPIAGYSTLTEDSRPSPPPSAPSSPGLSPSQAPSPSPTPAPSPSSFASSPSPSSNSPSLDIPSSTSDTPDMSSVWQGTLSSPSTLPGITEEAGMLPSASRPPASSSAADLSMSHKEGPSSASSAGVKTGIAFGVLGGVLATVLVALYFFRRRRRQARIRLDDEDEKYDPALGPPSPGPNGNSNPNPFSTPTKNIDRRAPHISLQRVGQLSPIGGAWDRRSPARSPRSANPFGNPVGNPANHAAGNNHGDGFPTTITEEQTLHSNGAAGLSRKTSMRSAGTNLDLTLPRSTSPAETEFSNSPLPPGSVPPFTNGAAAIEAAGGPANSGVHRVELEFTPTLDDEMYLNVGDLVRLLHEYDDGWCLVICLNRSEQGVVPRTDLHISASREASASTGSASPRAAREPDSRRPGSRPTTGLRAAHPAVDKVI